MYFLFLPVIVVLSVSILIFCWILTIFMSAPEATNVMLDGLSYFDMTVLAIIVLMCVYLPGLVFSLSYKLDTKIPLSWTILSAFFMPIYNLMQTPAVLLAFYRHITSPNSWVKTSRNNDNVDNNTN